MGNSNPLNSGDGSQPLTDGGVDNVGAGGGFDPKHPDSNIPSKRKASDDKPAKATPEQVKADDSDPLGLHDAPSSVPNTEPR